MSPIENRSMDRPMRRLFAVLTAILCAAAAPAPVPRGASETPARFAARVLHRPEGELQVVDTRWNGQPAIVVDYLTTRHISKTVDASERKVVALLKEDGAHWRPVSVATIDEEGGIAEIAAVGFANADRDRARELIVLVRWPQVHYDYNGAFYEVRIYDDAQAGENTLRYLAETSKMFGGLACDCEYRDGRKGDRAPYTTIAAIRKKLARSGY